MFCPPIFLVVIQTLVTAAIIGFTPGRSALRWGAFPLLAFCVWQCIYSSIHYLVRSPWASLVGGHSVTLLFQYIDLALVKEWTIELSGLNPMERSWTQRLSFGLSSTWNSRFVGTQDQVKYVPQFSNTDARSVPTRWVFLRNMVIRILLSYATLDILGASADPKLSSQFFTLAKIPIFRRSRDVSVEELLMRVGCVFGTGIGLVATQGGIYCMFALTGVCLGVTQPKDWPPFYGSISDAYTLRRLWSRSWHQSNAHKLNSISRYVTYDILGIRPRTRSAKYIRMCVVFATSALMHVLIDISAGISVYDSGAISFFCAQIIGILAEDSVRAVYCLIRPQDKAETPSAVQRAVGFAWVGAFLVWSLPAYVYPMMYRGSMGLDDSVVPVSLAKLLVA